MDHVLSGTLLGDADRLLGDADRLLIADAMDENHASAMGFVGEADRTLMAVAALAFVGDTDRLLGVSGWCLLGDADR